MKTKSKISGCTIRSGALAVFLSVAFIALSSAFDSPNVWHKSAATTAVYDIMSKAPSQPRAFSFAERVAFQRAIEEVYWAHRIWPKENPDPKPSLEAVMSQAQVENKVAGYLRDSLVLEDYWQKRITAEQLQAEMDRMARDTKQPKVLRELFEALGNDPVVIAECLARPILAERLIADLPVQDQTRHVGSPQTDALRAISVATTLGHVIYTLPRMADAGDPPCASDSWTATSTTSVPSARVEHTAIWTGSEMIVWGGGGEGGDVNTGGRYNPSTDSWTATNLNKSPSARSLHTEVWTGSEMIVWGGYDDFLNALNTGGRYNPATNSWTTTSTNNAPTARADQTAVWTGNKMVVWGGTNDSVNGLDTGGRYNPSTDSWTPTTTNNAPNRRLAHTAVWTGSEMIIWGGYHFGRLNTGGRYDPSTDSWIAISTANAPAGRLAHTAVWAGSEMIIWGGLDVGGLSNTGGRYNPSTDSWTATNTTNVPTARGNQTAVWTGSEMIVWGGDVGFNYSNTGGRYNPDSDSWTATSTNNAPSARQKHTAIWTGSEMIVWSGDAGAMGLTNTGGRYCAQCSVTGTACGRIVVGAPPTDFTINLSDAVDPATVQPSDFTVNGIPADDDIIVNGDLTLTFHFNTSPVVGGQNTMHIPPGAFDCGQGPVQEFTCTFFYRLPGATPPPRPRPTPQPRPTP